MFWRETVVIKLAAKRQLQRDATDALIQTVAERDRDMAEALTRDWNSSRFPDAARKAGTGRRSGAERSNALPVRAGNGLFRLSSQPSGSLVSTYGSRAG